ncbi:hypothetical protein GUITHDRAFT_140473 [Guillardia theta CCMP2712]|uniref:NYN domain-containing protein n=1 Tax=Guillardia theta (strain CCMP2712) TaxID=905079 RepID=L1J5R7_GUITC|nr:hypothetical protein GUITHDRAFT_140473 [Guillardia theta CCMP2712]EKX43425.1 hypothetical protein GUITHDRAFT_140473 [Guillardia theta CCMP2712]|eukprot:XP_005830405.1 hypothetical protein GUITHDRAFT_140473 [Guillardia theta CCMP2712]
MEEGTFLRLLPAFVLLCCIHSTSLLEQRAMSPLQVLERAQERPAAVVRLRGGSQEMGSSKIAGEIGQGVMAPVQATGNARAAGARTSEGETSLQCHKCGYDRFFSPMKKDLMSSRGQANEDLSTQIERGRLIALEEAKFGRKFTVEDLDAESERRGEEKAEDSMRLERFLELSSSVAEQVTAGRVVHTVKDAQNKRSAEREASKLAIAGIKLLYADQLKNVKKWASREDDSRFGNEREGELEGDVSGAAEEDSRLLLSPVANAKLSQDQSQTIKSMLRGTTWADDELLAPSESQGCGEEQRRQEEERGGEGRREGEEQQQRGDGENDKHSESCTQALEPVISMFDDDDEGKDEQYKLNDVSLQSDEKLAEAPGGCDGGTCRETDEMECEEEGEEKEALEGATGGKEAMTMDDKRDGGGDGELNPKGSTGGRVVEGQEQGVRAGKQTEHEAPAGLTEQEVAVDSVQIVGAGQGGMCNVPMLKEETMEDEVVATHQLHLASREVGQREEAMLVQEDGNMSWWERKSVWQREMENRLASFRKRNHEMSEGREEVNQTSSSNSSEAFNSTSPRRAAAAELRKKEKKKRTCEGGAGGADAHNVTKKAPAVQLLVDGDNSGKILKIISKWYQQPSSSIRKKHPVQVFCSRHYDGMMPNPLNFHRASTGLPEAADHEISFFAGRKCEEWKRTETFVLVISRDDAIENTVQLLRRSGVASAYVTPVAITSRENLNNIVKQKVFDSIQ